MFLLKRVELGNLLTDKGGRTIYDWFNKVMFSSLCVDYKWFTNETRSVISFTVCRHSRGYLLSVTGGVVSTSLPPGSF